MGDFRITVKAVGGHGCQREVKDGGTVYGCRSMICPDCITARYVSEMKRAGVAVEAATIEHWPGTANQVIDEFDVDRNSSLAIAARTRRGSF
jgi:hypothetical protein